MEYLKKKMEEQCSFYQCPLSQGAIFSQFITSDEQLQKYWENLQNPINSVCGTQVSKGELTFQCFTCSSNPHHMYCYSCFDTSLHINHKCIVKQNIGGCCNCGDEQTIRQEGFCSKHQGFSNVDQTKELLKIPIELQNKVRDFIKACCIVYLKYMKLVNEDYLLYHVLVIQCYHYSEKWGIQPIKDVVDAKRDIEIYYKSFQKALYLHNMLFSMIAFLTNSRLCFVLLITTILQEQLTPESKQSIMEDILEYQVILETQGPYESFNFQKLIYSFCANQSFKIFLQECYLRKYKNLWLVTYQNNSLLEKQIKSVLIQFKEIQNRSIIEANQQGMVEISKLLDAYIQELINMPFTTIQVKVSEIHQYESQYLSETFLGYFMNNKDTQNIFQMNSQLQNILQTTKFLWPHDLLELHLVLKARFEDNFFEKYAISQIQFAFGDNFIDFINKSANTQLLEQFQFNDFVLTAYIESFSAYQPIQLDIDIDNLTISQHELVEEIFVLTHQSIVIKTISIGIQQILKQDDRGYLKLNLAKLLLLQSYNIIKNNENKLRNVDLLLNEAYYKYMPGSPLSQQFDRLSEMHLLLLKSSSIIDKVFILLLCYVYNAQQWKTNDQFKSYLLNLFEEDSQMMQSQFSLILSRCIQTVISIQFCQSQYLNEIYFGRQDLKDQTILESFDSSFLRIYIFLFGIEGYQDFEKIIRGKHLPDISGVHKLQSAMLLRLVSTDIDMYNVCGHMFEELPNDLKLALAKITIEGRLISMGVKVTSNLSKHILQICELDVAVKKLKLKPEFKQIYDPAIFNVNVAFKGQIVEKLVENKRSESHILLGDGIKWDVEQFKTDKYRNILYNYLKFYSAKQYILKNISMLYYHHIFSLQTYQLCYVQIIAANYFRNQELKDLAPILIEELKKLYSYLNQNDLIKRLKFLIEEINNCTIKKLESEGSIEQQGPKQIVLKAKNKYQAKYQALQDSYIRTNKFEILTTRDHEQEYTKKDHSCSLCKLNLDEQEACAIIALTSKSNPQNFELPQLTVIDNINKFDVSINNCQHFFHKKCFFDHFEIHSQNIDQSLPNWIQLACPVCKQISNIRIPLAKQLKKAETEGFNSSLLLYLMEYFPGKNELSDEKKTHNLIIRTYYQLIFELLIQLFSNSTEFARNETFIIFQQLLRLLYDTALNLKEKYLKEEIILLNQQQSPVYSLLQIIEKQIVCQKDFNKYQEEATQWLINLGCDNEIKKLLSLCLQIPDVKQQQLVQQDEALYQYSQLHLYIQNTIIKILGENFETFYFRHFALNCWICKFYNINQIESNGAFVCILCSRVFCQFRCKNANTRNGNLNQHALQEHNGNSIYISLQTGDVTLLSCPTSISKYQCLYYNKLGYQINIEDPTTNWQDFVLDKQKVNQLAHIILNNTYQSIIRNLEVRKDQLDLQGNL